MAFVERVTPLTRTCPLAAERRSTFWRFPYEYTRRDERCVPPVASFALDRECIDTILLHLPNKLLPEFPP